MSCMPSTIPHGMYEEGSTGRSPPCRLWREFSVSQVADVLDKIQNVVLELALEIEAANPDPGEARSARCPSNPSGSRRSSTGGRKRPGAVIGRRRFGNLDSVRGRRGAPGDLHSLIEWLREANYDEADIQALQRALAEDGEAREEIRPSTQRWLGRMTALAASGAGRAEAHVRPTTRKPGGQHMPNPTHASPQAQGPRFGVSHPLTGYPLPISSLLPHRMYA